MSSAIKIQIDPYEEAKQLKPHFDKFNENFNDPNNKFFYVISKKWLDSWKLYTGYNKLENMNHIQEETSPKKYFNNQNYQVMEEEFKQPKLINEDLIISNYKDIFKYKEDNHIGNIYLKQGITLGVDYEVITETMWELFMNWYEGIEIKRPVYYLKDGNKRIEISLYTLKIIFIDFKIIELIDTYSIERFNEYRFQAYSQNLISELKENIIEGLLAHDQLKKVFTYVDAYTKKQIYCNEGISNIKSGNVRLWKLDSFINSNEFFKKIKDCCKTSFLNNEVAIPFCGQLLDINQSIILGDAEIADDEYIIVEIKDTNGNWNFIGNGAVIHSKCSSCDKKADLEFHCLCSKASYCSSKCKFRDRPIHMAICSKKDEIELKKFGDPTENSFSRYGVCGLKNLGNTCYMNSSLQCLSHIQPLTEYFLSDKYLDDINKDNLLGTKGKIAKKYASLLKNLWYGREASLVPWEMKKTIEEFNSIFVGHQQHDSQEFLSFLLDKLHEDLNTVKKKPYIEGIEHKNEDDAEKGRLSWINHLKRDNSLIVRLMSGQFKSKIICPECFKISITFDPFFLVSVPFPIKVDKNTEVKNSKAVDEELGCASSSSASGWHEKVNDLNEVEKKPNKVKEIMSIVFINADKHQIPTKINIDITDEILDWTISKYKNVLAQKFHANPNKLYFVFLNFFASEIIQNENEMTMSNLYDKWRWKPSLFLTEMTDEEFDLDSNKRIITDIQICRAPLNDRENRIQLSHVSSIIISKDDSYRQVHLKIFKYFKFIFDENVDLTIFAYWSKLSLEQAYSELFDDPSKAPYILNIRTNTRGIKQCHFCGKLRCENCEFPMSDDKTIEKDLMPKYIDDEGYNFGFEMVWTNSHEVPFLGKIDHTAFANRLIKVKEFENDAEGAKAAQPTNAVAPKPLMGLIPEVIEEETNMDIPAAVAEPFGAKPMLAIEWKPNDDDWDVTAPYNESQMSSTYHNVSSKLENYTLLECLKQFEEPEVLTEQNEWYCSQCKAHQRATKEWKIYKAPPILVIHLKRFRSIHQKIQNKVIFPINNLDLTDYILNHELPMDYNLKEEQNSNKKLEKNGNSPNHVNEPFENMTKNSHNNVEFNQEQFMNEKENSIDLPDFNNDGMDIDKPRLLYDLFAVSNHLGGSSTAGHYTAYCKNFKTSKWYLFNDQSVTEVDEDNVCTEDAYVLFYKKKEVN